MNALFDITKIERGYKMATEEMTQQQYLDRIADYRERYGWDMLKWPRNLRERIRNIKILKEVKLEWRQLRLGEESPYGNTGVTNE